jgi:hypothetical protein
MNLHHSDTCPHADTRNASVFLRALPAAPPLVAQVIDFTVSALRFLMVSILDR